MKKVIKLGFAWLFIANISTSVFTFPVDGKASILHPLAQEIYQGSDVSLFLNRIRDCTTQDKALLKSFIDKLNKIRQRGGEQEVILRSFEMTVDKIFIDLLSQNRELLFSMLIEECFNDFTKKTLNENQETKEALKRIQGKELDIIKKFKFNLHKIAWTTIGKIPRGSTDISEVLTDPIETTSICSFALEIHDYYEQASKQKKLALEHIKFENQLGAFCPSLGGLSLSLSEEDFDFFDFNVVSTKEDSVFSDVRNAKKFLTNIVIHFHCIEDNVDLNKYLKNLQGCTISQKKILRSFISELIEHKYNLQLMIEIKIKFFMKLI